MLFYVQQVDIDKASKHHDVILDVFTMDTHLQLASLLDGGQRTFPHEKATASMLRFTYTPSGSRGLKEGSWYDIDPGIFNGAVYQRVDPDSGGASFLRANLLGLADEYNFAQFLATPQVANISGATEKMVVDFDPKGDVELTVVSCGHGNWNEINTTTDRLIYDVGASRRFTKTQVKALVAGRDIVNETRPVSVVISHWDVDHYHALLEFDTAELAKIRVVFAPSQVPDTETYRRVSALLSINSVPFQAVQPATRSTTSREIILECLWQKGIFTMFRATSGRSRNQTGIVLGVRGRNQVALLTGDHHYNKVLSAAMKVSNYSRRDCVLVTPHHGRLAGNLVATDWLAYFSKLTTPISCGANSHGHPIPDVEVALTTMQTGKIPMRTDIIGTWATVL